MASGREEDLSYELYTCKSYQNCFATIVEGVTSTLKSISESIQLVASETSSLSSAAQVAYSGLHHDVELLIEAFQGFREIQQVLADQNDQKLRLLQQQLEVLQSLNNLQWICTICQLIIVIGCGYVIRDVWQRYHCHNYTICHSEGDSHGVEMQEGRHSQHDDRKKHTTTTTTRMLGGYRLPSLTTVVCGLFMAYILQSLWTLGQLFVHPSCPSTTHCYQPLIAQKPTMQLLAFTSQFRSPSRPGELELVHRLKPFPYDDPREDVLEVSLPQRVRNNGSLFLHLFLTPPHIDPEDWGDLAGGEHSVYAFSPLTQYQVPEATTFNLLGDDKGKDKDKDKERQQEGSRSKASSAKQNQQDEKQKTQKAVTHFQSQVTFNILTDAVGLPKHDMPYDLGHALRLDSRGRYLPILHVDSLSARLRDLVEVTPSLKRTNLTLKYAPISYGKLRLWMQFEGALRPMASLGFSARDLDEVKGVFSDTSLYFLFVTFLVAALHMLFDFLAFKNDITFWRGRRSMAGLSPSYVAWRAISQAIVFLYLLEENTSLLVLVPAGVGGIIELWKVTKAFHIRFEGWRPKVEHAITSGESATRALDSEGIRYLSYLLYPLLVCGAIYSLLYTPHRSWYSWLINSLVNGVYAFGFLFMLPQLFINYKLKSVAHLPWKTFMYKAFNTFIDDLFAFIITMPTAHRVACFRDDVVFLIYLFQRWLYPVDKSRVNEFGETGEEVTQKDKKE